MEPEGGLGESPKIGLKIVVHTVIPFGSTSSPSREPGYLVPGFVLTPSTDKASLFGQTLLGSSELSSHLIPDF